MPIFRSAEMVVRWNKRRNYYLR